MSYILEALRRAETERERKRRVPGLHAQPVPTVSLGESDTPRSKTWLWVVASVGAGVLLPLLWRSWPSPAAPEDTGSARAAVAGSVAFHGATAATDAPHAPAAAVATPASLPAPGEAAAVTAPAAQAAPKAVAAAKPDTTRMPPKPAARPPAAATPPQATPTQAAAAEGARRAPAITAAPAGAPEPRLRSLAELPEELRRGVPALSFGGSVYSETAAQRMVIFNGQVLREGDAVTDELLLEQIRPRSAVMRIRGQRFEVAF